MDDMSTSINYTPRNWLVVFYPRSVYTWVNRLVPGRFKHVSLISFIQPADAWLYYSVEPTGCPIELWPGNEAGSRRFAEITASASIIRFPAVMERNSWLRAGWWCVPAVKHALGIRSGALLPDQLWRYLVANGGEIVKDETGYSETGSVDRCRAEAG